MLQIQHICKEYRTGTLVQKALDDVSLNFRDNEFVAILGPSGSGKTTFLNIIGGLDRYDSGDLIINGISTKKYKDRDWDSYRNHTIGFVFQSYNLIPHQTVLANVELALTISGIGKEERKKRAIEALKKVGLGEQLHKKPSQMSGGQMQRVAIARALVNDPDILLADEPTGALDTATSVQVMELLKEVAKDRLVVMVTHNPELAEEYATRIVTLKDGKIRSDTDEFYVNEAVMKAVLEGTVAKGDVLGVARVAGIMAVKQTAHLIPMCHTLLITKCSVDFEVDEKELTIKALCTAKLEGKTGVEMEALTGVSVALLTIYDMCKAIDKRMEIGEIHLDAKSGGKSGEFVR